MDEDLLITCKVICGGFIDLACAPQLLTEFSFSVSYPKVQVESCVNHQVVDTPGVSLRMFVCLPPRVKRYKNYAATPLHLALILPSTRVKLFNPYAAQLRVTAKPFFPSTQTESDER